MIAGHQQALTPIRRFPEYAGGRADDRRAQPWHRQGGARPAVTEPSRRSTPFDAPEHVGANPGSSTCFSRWGHETCFPTARGRLRRITKRDRALRTTVRGLDRCAALCGTSAATLPQPARRAGGRRPRGRSPRRGRTCATSIPHAVTVRSGATPSAKRIGRIASDAAMKQ